MGKLNGRSIGILRVVEDNLGIRDSQAKSDLKMEYIYRFDRSLSGEVLSTFKHFGEELPKASHSRSNGVEIISFKFDRLDDFSMPVRTEISQWLNGD